MIHATPPAHIADGVYYYGRNYAEWKITIENGGRRIIEETTNNTRIPARFEFAFDQTTLILKTVSAFVAHIGPAPPGGASPTPVPSAAPKFSPLPGTNRIISWDPYVLPLIVARSGEQAFTIDRATVMRVDGPCTYATPVRLRTDDCLRVTWDGPNSSWMGTHEEIWYDPNTFVVDRYIRGNDAPFDRVDY